MNKERQLKVPVLFMTFNRLDNTKQVFEAIRKAQPSRFYFLSDGPRSGVKGEPEKVNAVRDYVLSNIDWDCEVKTLLRQSNLGSGISCSTGIDWFFENEEMGIILEDDTLPSDSFFRYCEELLIRYKDCDEVGIISGYNQSTPAGLFEHSYGFTKFCSMWGWATWKRIWTDYDYDIASWPDNKDKIFSSEKIAKFWIPTFKDTYKNPDKTWWDYQLVYLLFLQQKKYICPSVNLITNIGFGEDATHTFNENCSDAKADKFDISFPLVHPESTALDNKVDSFLDKKFSHKTLFYRIVRKLINFIK